MCRLFRSQSFRVLHHEYFDEMKLVSIKMYARCQIVIFRRHVLHRRRKDARSVRLVEVLLGSPIFNTTIYAMANEIGLVCVCSMCEF